MKRKKSATVDLKLRMKEPLRAKIAATAKKNGVSMNSEIVERVERSFQKDQALHESFGDESAYRLLLFFSNYASLIETEMQEDDPERFGPWYRDPNVFYTALGCWETAIDAMFKIRGKDPTLNLALSPEGLKESYRKLGAQWFRNHLAAPVETQ
jgi:hypothetical protein